MKQTQDNLVRCPMCQNSCLAIGHSLENDAVCCPGCGAEYPVHDGVPDLIPDLQFERGRAQALMESPTMARLYAGKWWRRSYWQGALLGIQFEREATIVMEAAGVQATSTVMDLACASGIYTRLFAQTATKGRVVGLDLSMPMLKVARGIEMQERRGNITYVRGTAQALPFGDASFDCVNCCGALHLFPDPYAVLLEISRVLKPGGRFTVGTFRKREGMLGNARTKTATSIGVNMFTPQGVTSGLVASGLVNIRVLHDAARWMILSAEKRQPA